MLHILASKHDVLRALSPKPRPPYEEVWHLWTVLVPRRSITGRLLWGTVLRRRDDGRWIYRQYTGSIEPTEFRVRAHQSLVVSRKTGARARVGVAHAARFQAYIDDLETNHGARVLFMGGVRPGRCSPSSEHPCGKALDVGQLSRGVVDRHCNLPGRVTLGQVAAAHGLFEGGRWCNSDYGHAQVDVTAAGCGERRIRIVQSRSVQ
jgi:hypothetical protein